MVGLNVANAAGRHVLGRAILGADEILVFAMAWLVFVGAALVTWDGRHLSVDLIDRALPGPLLRLRAAVELLAVALLAGFVALQSLDVIARLAKVGQVSMAAQIPMTLPHASLAVGFGLAAGLALLRLALLIRGGEKPSSE
jgi:TRAP-type C4-dicarboxylate transport system permease small subunit